MVTLYDQGMTRVIKIIWSLHMISMLPYTNNHIDLRGLYATPYSLLLSSKTLSNYPSFNDYILLLLYTHIIIYNYTTYYYI